MSNNRSTAIHPSAVVDPKAQIGTDVTIGPFCMVGPDVVLGDRSELVSHVVVTGVTSIGEETRIFPQAVVGCQPQNNKHQGGKTKLTIGKRCTIREGVTIHTGSDSGRGETTIGDDCLFLAYSHIAHDCIVGNHVTMTNQSALSGHVELEDHVNIAGMSGVHQFVRIGHHAFIAGMTGVRGDVIPYGLVAGSELGGNLRGLNIIGIKRSGLARNELSALRKAFSQLFDANRPMLENARHLIENFPDSAAVADIVRFVSQHEKGHYCVPPSRNGGNGNRVEND